jgi:leucyl/phenylalanyl-tRNA---protein transferase
MLTWIDDNGPLPPGSQAMGPDDDVPGLVAAGGRVTPQRLEEAYRKGIFPWYSPGQPVLWWSPEPRMVLPVAEFRLSHSLKKTLRRFARTPGCEVRVDSAFERVIQACAQTPRDGQDGTWIVPAMVDAYIAWHRQGRVHSVETWIDGELCGGLYGVSIGRMFFGESMFAWRTDASKIALAALITLCREQGVPWIDCQQNTRHLASFGAREVTRQAFEQHLAAVLPEADVPDWTYHPSLWRHLLDQPDGRHGAPALDDPP